MKKNVLLLSFLLIICSFSACCDNVNKEDINLGIEIVQEKESVGNFVVINMVTNDTIKVDGNLGVGDSLLAQNGNIIRMYFEPSDKYKSLHFDTIRVVHNGNLVKIEGKENEYTVGDTVRGSYSVLLASSAIYEKDTINAVGTFMMVIDK